MSTDHIFIPKSLDSTVNTVRGTEIMEELLLNQYTSSTNLGEYMGAFISEVDLLLEQTERVYLGRFLEYATGEQLDVIGRIVGQSRAIALPTTFFGFQGAANVAGMADETSPNNGGVFQSEESIGFEVPPLDDITYRRVLRAKAYMNMADQPTIEFMYRIIPMLVGKMPRVLNLVDVADRNVRLDISSSDVGDTETGLINYFAKYFVTNTVIFNLNLV